MRWLGTIAVLTTLGAAAPEPRVELEAAKQLLPGADDCQSIGCLIESAYRGDPKAAELALRLWRATGDVAGVGPEETMAGGFRGTIRLVPQLPVHGYRKHLAWVAAGTQALARFFQQLFPAEQAQPSSPPSPLRSQTRDR